MSLTVKCRVHTKRHGRGGPKQLAFGEAQEPETPGRVPYVKRWMALAYRFEELIRTGVVADYAEIAKLSHVTRARACQIANLLLLAPDIQLAILQLPPIASGRDPVTMAQLQAIALEVDWRKQRTAWKTLRK